MGKYLIKQGLTEWLNDLVERGITKQEHVSNTPHRFVSALEEMFLGCRQTGEGALSTLFTSNSDEMIHVQDISYYSMCAHHLLPFFGMAHFAYIPNGQIVGLSKIPRLIEVYSRRPQVQEELTSQIVDKFMEVVQPRGCALAISGTHLCCSARGVRSQTSVMKTTALRGNFKEAAVKQEFLSSVSGR